MALAGAQLKENDSYGRFSKLPSGRSVLRVDVTAARGRDHRPIVLGPQSGHDRLRSMAHSTARANARRLLAVFGLSLLILAIEVVGGLASNSLALLADAAHVFTDAAGIGLALLAIWIGSRPASSERTYGYLRLEILAAVANAVLLFGVAGFILYEAWRRLSEPPAVASGLMFAVALVGLVLNGCLDVAAARSSGKEPQHTRRVPRSHGRPRRVGRGRRCCRRDLADRLDPVPMPLLRRPLPS